MYAFFLIPKYAADSILNLVEWAHQLHTLAWLVHLIHNGQPLLLVCMLSLLSFFLFVLDGRPHGSLYRHALINIATPPTHLIKVEDNPLSQRSEQPTPITFNLDQASSSRTTLVHMKKKSMMITSPEASTSMSRRSTHKPPPPAVYSHW